MPSIKHTAHDPGGPAFTGQDVVYRERGVTALDVRRAGDALLRLGQKPSIAAIRANLGGGSPNTLGPLLEKYWQELGARIAAGPDALERVPDSLARLTEALWRRALGEARARSEALARTPAPSATALAALESRVSELAAALADSRARSSEMEAQMLLALKGQLEARDQVRQLTAVLKADQQLRAHERERADAHAQELAIRRQQVADLTRRRLAKRAPAGTPRGSSIEVPRKKTSRPQKEASATPAERRQESVQSLSKRPGVVGANAETKVSRARRRSGRTKA